MKKRIKNKWLKALRSGDYEQGRGSLCGENNKMCCLGVLSDIYATEKGIAWGEDRDEDNYDILGEIYFPPTEILEWCGIEDDNWELPSSYKGIGTTLTELNDEAEKSFKQIANVIEKHL